MDPVQHSNDLVRNGGQITEIKQGDPGEQTSKLQSNENDYESEYISELVSRKMDQIDEMMQGEASEENLDHSKDHVRYRPFYKALQENDWKAIEDLVKKDPQSLTSKIKAHGIETFFHTISRNLNAPISLLKKLTSEVKPELLESLTDYRGWSPLFQAAAYGNTEAAKAFESRNERLPNIRDSQGVLPIHLSAEYGHKETTQYLLSVTTISLDDDKGVVLFQALIRSGISGKCDSQIWGLSWGSNCENQKVGEPKVM